MASKADIESLLTGNNAAFIESQYARFLEDPGTVNEDWRDFFTRMEDGAEKTAKFHPSWQRDDWPPRHDGGFSDIVEDKREGLPTALSAEDVRKATLDSIRALMMIRAYRVRGHLIANLDPLGLEDRPPHPELQPETYGFSKSDLDRPIFIDNVLGLESATIREILDILHKTYCSHVGVEFMHISEPEEKAWIQEHIEGRGKEIHFTDEGKKAILEKLVEGEHFEKYLAKKYVGTKRFGLDGAESMVPALESIIKTGGQEGVKEIVLGMAHRGRLNVLGNVMKKPFRAIFHEFHGGSAHPDDVQGSGDVKYHLGTSADREFDGNKVHLSLTANPSHLEAVDPVVLGKARAKQAQRGDKEHAEVLSLLIHGDAAFAGQGIVAECFMFSDLKGFRTGGTIHFILNNQIGFTTNPLNSRTQPYPSDSAKMVQAPIFHVNGDDPEAVVYVTKMATLFRQAFKKDVVIDMVCYRRFGHNESDEPSFTQPRMYERIRKHEGVSEIYRDRLKKEGLVDDKGFEKIKDNYLSMLDEERKKGEKYRPEKADQFEAKWEGFGPHDNKIGFVKTGAPEKTLKEIGKQLTTVPDDFHLHKTLKKFLENRKKMFSGNKKFDWATAEVLSFGTLLKDGYGVRLSGQDSIRGTFSQRHAEFVDQVTEERFNPLSQIKSNALYEFIDSPLSEMGVLGFEYGYTQAEPMSLVMWEAQFGDFMNVAQVIIDQFISSAEAKWLRSSGLVMLLPHGYEGQGPEHSSARPERFLQMCANNNMQVANCTTPANYFHILRRQMLRKFRKPLVIMTPKSLLRHKRATSSLDEMSGKTGFLHILEDDAERLKDQKIKLKADKNIKRIVLCTGKVYYDLYEAREEEGIDDVYILRVEQLYPFPHDMILEVIKRFHGLESVVWCQEEPKNMGAWTFVAPRLEEVLKDVGKKGPAVAQYVGRKESAAPATGLASVHEKEQAEIVEKALKA